MAPTIPKINWSMCRKKSDGGKKFCPSHLLTDHYVQYE